MPRRQPSAKWSEINALSDSRFPIFDGGGAAVSRPSPAHFDPVDPGDLGVDAMYHKQPTIGCDTEYQNLPHGAQCTLDVAKRPENKQVCLCVYVCVCTRVCICLYVSVSLCMGVGVCV